MSPEEVRAALAPSIDRPYLDEFGDWVWLRPLVRNGRQIGLTQCCFCSSDSHFDEPCDLHRAKGGPS